MALPIPNLDDKLFPQLTEEARALIPPRSPEWTDFNLHDPGITFLELFAWLAETQRYRLNRTSKSGLERMLAMAGVVRHALAPAVVEIAVENAPAMLLPSNTRVVAVGKDELPFETLHDVVLTGARLAEVITNAGGRDVRQTTAEVHDGGHFEAFGPRPEPGDSLRLGFDTWFEDQIRINVILYEDDLPARTPIATGGAGFAPSAAIRWEYLADTGAWLPLTVIEDGTLGFAQSGDVLAAKAGPALKRNGRYWMRAMITGGSFEIAPRIFDLRINVVRARQVETIGNEDLGPGRGTPNQMVRLRRYPLLVDDRDADGPFETGDVLDWQALIMRLGKPDKLNDSARRAMVEYVASQLGPEAAAIVGNPELNDRANPKFRKPLPSEIAVLARAFTQLMANDELYQPARFPGFVPPPDGGCAACAAEGSLRQLNRALLRFAFPDLMGGDRLEIQTGTPTSNVEDEPNRWTSWQRVESFENSAPADLHFVLDPKTGEIIFGNGLNGRVPAIGESIRARFYRFSQGSKGNLPAPQTWQIAAPDGSNLRGLSEYAASGGSEPESTAGARFRARREFRVPWRALTASDYQVLAKQTPGLRVAQVKVLSNWNPVLRCTRISGDVTLVVLPFANNAASPPVPSPGFLNTVQRFIDGRRPVTTRVFVIGPAFVPIKVTGKLFLRKGVSTSEALARAAKAVRRFLDPIRGGPGPEPGWPFGRDVFPSEIYQLLAAIEEIDYAAGIALNGRLNQQVALPPEGLPSVADVSFEAIPFENRNRASSARVPDVPRAALAPRRTGGCGCD